jgi:glucose-1-phosphate thymidylyltransferase
MKLVLPLAGLGTRMRPHTWSKPKPLLNVAGKAVLGHVLDAALPAGVDEVVFITGWLGNQIKEYIDATYAGRFVAHYVVQEQLQGQAHAIYLAKEHLSGPCMVIFVDTLFEADLSGLSADLADVVLFVQEVEDPRRFGVAVEEQGRVTRLIEKPDTCEHRKAVVGLYYVADGAALSAAIAELLERGIQTKGEYYLADAFNVMIQHGARVITRPVSVWEDCGVPDTVLHTNQYLLAHGHDREAPTINSVLVPPVHIAEGAHIENAVVGPYVTVGEGVRIVNAVVRDAIIEAGSSVENVVLEHTLIGRNARVKGAIGRLNIGDDDALDLG